MLVIDCKQREDVWYSERLGKPTASRFSEIITTSGEPSKQRKGYLYDLAAQIITGKSEDSYQSLAMVEGINREDESRFLYEMITGLTVRQVGMIYPDESKKYLCSPDGLVECNPPKGLELKNVLPRTQVEYLLSKKLPAKYFQQVQGSLLISGFEQWDFMSYSPGLPPLIIPVYRDEVFLVKLEHELENFVCELMETVEKLRKG